MTNYFRQLPLIEISWGEFFDRLTILEIKLVKITDYEKRLKVEDSLKLLVSCGKNLSDFPENIQQLYQKLLEINSDLWDIEDAKRDCERQKYFGEEFISLARSVYIKNDKRAQLKRDIDLILDSKLVEVKSHQSY